MYGKLWASTFTGSMFGAGPTVFAVWAYCIACKQADQTIELNPALVAAQLGADIEAVRKAIEYLCAPDPQSRSTDNDGRRLDHIEAYLYHVVNGSKYQYQQTSAAARQAAANRKRAQRERERLSAGIEPPGAPNQTANRARDETGRFVPSQRDIQQSHRDTAMSHRDMGHTVTFHSHSVTDGESHRDAVDMSQRDTMESQRDMTVSQRDNPQCHATETETYTTLGSVGVCNTRTSRAREGEPPEEHTHTQQPQSTASDGHRTAQDGLQGDITPQVVPTQRPPTENAATAVCVALRKRGWPIQAINPNHPQLVALTQHGIPPDEIIAAADECDARGIRNLVYLCAIVTNRRKRAAGLTADLTAIPPSDQAGVVVRPHSKTGQAVDRLLNGGLTHALTQRARGMVPLGDQSRTIEPALPGPPRDPWDGPD